TAESVATNRNSNGSGQAFIDLMGTSSVIPIKNHLAAVAGLHGSEALLEFRVVEAMGDHGLDVEAALQHHGHLVPRLIHLTPVDAVNREHVENDLGPINGDLFRRNAQHGDASAMAHVVDH